MRSLLLFGFSKTVENHLKDHLMCHMQSLEDLKHKHELNVANRAKYVIKRPKQRDGNARIKLDTGVYTGDVIEEWWDNKKIRTHTFIVQRYASGGTRYDATKYKLETETHVRDKGDIPDLIWNGTWEAQQGFYYDHETPYAFEPPHQRGDWGIYREDVSKVQDEYTEQVFKSKMENITLLKRYVNERTTILETAVQNLLLLSTMALRLRYSLDKTGAFESVEVLTKRYEEKVQEIQKVMSEVSASQRSVAATLQDNHEMPVIAAGMGQLLARMRSLSSTPGGASDPTEPTKSLSISTDHGSV